MKLASSMVSRMGAAMTLTWFYAQNVYAQGLPWEGPLTTLQKSLTGPIAKAIGIIALAVSGGMLAFGGELSDFTKRIMMVVLAIAVLMMADQMISSIGITSGG